MTRASNPCQGLGSLAQTAWAGDPPPVNTTPGLGGAQHALAQFLDIEFHLVPKPLKHIVLAHPDIPARVIIQRQLLASTPNYPSPRSGAFFPVSTEMRSPRSGIKMRWRWSGLSWNLKMEISQAIAVTNEAIEKLGDLKWEVDPLEEGAVFEVVKELLSKLEKSSYLLQKYSSRLLHNNLQYKVLVLQETLDLFAFLSPVSAPGMNEARKHIFRWLYDGEKIRLYASKPRGRNNFQNLSLKWEKRKFVDEMQRAHFRGLYRAVDTAREVLVTASHAVRSEPFASMLTRSARLVDQIQAGSLDLLYIEADLELAGGHELIKIVWRIIWLATRTPITSSQDLRNRRMSSGVKRLYYTSDVILDAQTDDKFKNDPDPASSDEYSTSTQIASLLHALTWLQSPAKEIFRRKPRETKPSEAESSREILDPDRLLSAEDFKDAMRSESEVASKLATSSSRRRRRRGKKVEFASRSLDTDFFTFRGGRREELAKSKKVW